MATLDELEARLQQEIADEDRASAGRAVTAKMHEDHAVAPPAPTSKLDELEARLQAETLPTVDGVDSSYGSLLRGFNTNVGRLLGLPGETVNAVLGLVGANPAQPGDITQKIMEGFNQLGVKMDPNAKGVLDRIGGEAFNAVLMTMGLRTAAPTIAGRTAGSQTAGGQVVNRVAEDIIAKPVTALASSVTAAPGVVIGREAGGQAGESFGEAVAGGPGVTSRTLRAVGEEIGGLGGGSLTSVPGVMLAQRVPGLARSERAQLPQAGSAILDDAANPQATKVFARDQIHRELGAIDNGIENAIRQARGSATAADDISSNLRERLDTVYEQSRVLERRAWGAIPGRTRVNDTSNISTLAQRQIASTDADPSRVPDQAQRFLDANQRIADGRRGPWTVSELLEMRSGLLTEARNARSGTRQGGQNPTLANNLEELADETLVSIERALPPNDPRVQRARALSFELNNRFTRGPIAEVLSTTRAGENRVHPSDAVNALIRDRDGPGAVATTREPLNRAISTLRTPGGQEAMDVMDDAIRASYADEVQRAVDDQALRASASSDPYTARLTDKGHRAARITSERWMQRNESRIQAYTRASTQVEDANRAIVDWSRERERLTSGAFAGVAQRGAELEARDILNGRVQDVTARIREIKDQFNIRATTTSTHRRTGQTYQAVIGYDHAAEDGFKRAMFNEAFGEVKSASRAALLLEEPKRRAALMETFSADEFKRLERIIKTAAQLETKDPRVGRRAAAFAATGMGRIIGLWLGRVAAHTLTPNNAAGSLSLPARFGSNMSKRAGSIFDEEAPVNLLTLAIKDPRVEKILMERLPSNLAEAKAYTTRVRRLMAGLEASRQSLLALPDTHERSRKE